MRSVVSFFIVSVSDGGLRLEPSDMASAGEACEPKWLYMCVIPIRSKAACHLIGFVNALVKMSAAIASVLQ